MPTQKFKASRNVVNYESNSFPYTTNADDFENIMANYEKNPLMKFYLLNRVKRNSGKWGKLSWWAISPFATMFLKVVRKRLYVGKGKIC